MESVYPQSSDHDQPFQPIIPQETNNNYFKTLTIKINLQWPKSHTRHLTISNIVYIPLFWFFRAFIRF